MGGLYKRYLSDKSSKDSIQICTANAHFKEGNIFTRTCNQRFHTNERPLLPFVHFSISYCLYAAKLLVIFT